MTNSTLAFIPNSLCLSFPSSGVSPVAYRIITEKFTEGILVWFRQRWQVEVTFEEVRRHLGMETQRQWADLAILRTTPTLLGLFSFITLLASQCQSELPLRQAAWYVKPLPTFVDALALVRCLFWKSRLFQTSAHLTEVVKVPQELLNCWTDLLCYAA